MTINPLEDREFQEYQRLFIGHTDSHGLKLPNRNKWRKIQGSPRVGNVIDHLVNPGGVSVAVKSVWYPNYAFIDFDDWKEERVNTHRESMGLNDSNSMLVKSESQDSYHLYFKPRYKDNPITVNLLHNALGEYITKTGAELYPHKHRIFRLPMGARSSTPLDERYFTFTDWRDKFYWGEKLDPIDITDFSFQLDLFQEYKAPTEGQPEKNGGSFYQRGKELFITGLMSPRTRNESTFCVLYYLWRKNTHPEEARQIVRKWLKTKHNGMSKTVTAGKWVEINREINAQIDKIWNTYTLPDTTYNNHFGGLSKSDIVEAVKVCKGNWPKTKCLTELVRWYRPRRFKGRVALHSEKLKNEIGRKGTYLEYLNEFETCGLVKRKEGRQGYLKGVTSKSIELTWGFNESPVMVDGDRGGNVFKTANKTFTSREFNQLLTSQGMDRSNAHRLTKTVFSPDLL